MQERSRLGTAPARKGRPFNQTEYLALKVETMLDVLDPGRPTALAGGVLSAHAADDVRQLHHFATHPEMRVRCAPLPCMPRTSSGARTWMNTARVQPNLGRPELFPAWTEEQVRPEVIDAQLEQRRDDMTHPLLGIHSEEDWQEFKAECAPRLPRAVI